MDWLITKPFFHRAHGAADAHVGFISTWGRARGRARGRGRGRRRDRDRGGDDATT